MKYTAAIFDLDGTLLNTLGDLADAVNAAIVPRGLAPATTEQVRQRVGNGIRNLIRLSMPEDTPDAEIDACLSEFRAYYNDHMMNRTVPYDGVADVLRAFKEAGLRIAVLSNKYDPASKALIAHFFPGLVDLTFGERPGVPRKPDPTSCREAMDVLGVKPEQTIYIGDSAVDMNTAKNAGVDSIGVTWGFRSREVLIESGAGVLADTPYELMTQVLGVDVDALKKAFTGHGFAFSYFETREQAVAYLAEQCAGKRVGFGGSITLEELGAFDALSQTADVHWHWKGEKPCVDAEVFLTSANGLSATGEAVNLDGASNRVAASLYGAKECFLVCGVNKLAPTLEAAVARTRNVAAPRNAQRLNRKTPCAVTGKCHDCRSPERICSSLVIHLAPPLSFQRYEIVLVGEALGY
ncbi:MAG: HAD-IA family hydrolase [Butyricicoccus sp.]